MNQRSKVLLVRATNGEVSPANPFSSVVLSSAETNWHDLVVEEHHFHRHELENLMYVQRVFAVNLEIRREAIGAFTP
jgi:hypothetical protein